eukprot:GHUV01025847.1.p1 GENE.GHUV01025847.1~~GHUV01025847.1.p1  ORF type:complete len:142 (-),score=38.24 GHUV01025847.1:48-473(-)
MRLVRIYRGVASCWAVPCGRKGGAVACGHTNRLPAQGRVRQASINGTQAAASSSRAVHCCPCAGDEAATVEVHILHSYSHEEFYGAAIRVAIHGFIRPEIKFTGLQQLLARIKTDIGIAKSQLDEAAAAALRGHNIFRKQL